jgi:hypothetical protein
MIQLCKGILDLRENPVEYILLRVFFEAFVNFRYIFSEQDERPRRAKNFADFSEVSRLRLMQEIARRFPHIPQPVDSAILNGSLEKYKNRFRHKRSDDSPYWDWDKLDLVSRVESIGKTYKSREDANKFKRIVALYSETNPYVHSGMYSLKDSLDTAGGGEAVRPKLRARHDLIGVPRLAATLLVETLGFASEVLDVHAFEREITSLGDYFNRLLKD